MLFAKTAGHPPSLLVEDGKTVTITADPTSGLYIQAVRPRTVAALMLICAVPLQNPPRLSDDSAFEKIDSTHKLVDVHKPDFEGRIDGYSGLFLRNVLRVLDPEAHMPATVKWQVVHPSPCHELKSSIDRFHPVDDSGQAKAKLSVAYSKDVFLSETEVPVPHFIASLNAVCHILMFDDMVVGSDSTLIIGKEVFFMIANNILCYHGSTIKQEGSSLAVDVTGTVRGSIVSPIHDVTPHGELRIHWDRLKLLPVEKL